MDKPVRVRVMREDEREERELRSYVVRALASDMINAMPGSINSQHPDEVKHPVDPQQQDETMQWSHQQQDQTGPR